MLNRFVLSLKNQRLFISPETKKKEKTFDALEWLAAMCSHVPNKGEQMVRYDGYYSNVSRGKRKKHNQDEWIPYILEPVEDPDFSGEGSSKEYRKNWARLIQKIYEIDPLTCAKSQGRMRIIASIEDEEVIKKILKYLGLWPVESLQVEREIEANKLRGE